jgi:uncharacterized membrane protein
MAFCVKCGASLSAGAAFCGACGSPVSTAPPAGSAPTNDTHSSAPFDRPIPSNGAAALAYLVGFITGIIFLVIEPYKRDSYVRFHAFQSILVSVVAVIVFTLLRAITGALVAVRLGVLASPFFMLWSLLELAFFLLWLVMMYRAYRNERFMLPFIGPLAAKQAG